MIRFLHRCNSTQDWAKKIKEEGIYICGTQIRGYGKEGRPWYSPTGLGLYMTIVKKAFLPPEELPRLPLKIASAVASWLKKQGLNCELKEPNDIMVNGKKISGILIEKRSEHLYIGVGINLNHKEEDFPYYLKGRATSLFMETGKRLNPLSIVPELLDFIEKTQ